VYSLSLAGEIWIEGTNNDAGMVGAAVMRPDEMSAVRQNCAAGCSRVIKHLLVGHRLPGLAGFLGCQNVVAETAQFLHDL